jgi:mycothiol synthase
VTLRTPRDEDASVVAALFNAHSPEPVDEDTIHRAWGSPTVDRERDVRLDGSGYALLFHTEDGRVWAELAGRPSAELLDWVERRAQELGPRLLSGGWSDNRPLLEELNARGFRLIRHSLRMEADLATEPPPAVWPEGIDVRSFQAGDERTFYDVHNETFRDHWEPVVLPFEEWLHWFVESPQFDPGLWFIAEEGEEPAGIAICSNRPTEPDVGWVGILGVRRQWRKHGLGRALLLHAFAVFRGRGLRRASLGVDAENLTGATRLYESAGMRATHRFDIYEQERS